MPIGNYTVAFLDILGFKEAIYHIPLGALSNRYEYIVVEIGELLNRPFRNVPKEISFFPKPQPRQEWCKRHIFSDSIILFSLDDTSDNCLKLLLYAWKFTQLLLGAGVPTRGGITFGEMYINKKKQVFLGKALTEAYVLEQNQQWIGTAIDDSVFRAFPVLDEAFKGPLLQDIFFEYDVPMKNCKTQRVRTLNWRWNLVIEAGTRSLFPLSKDRKIKKKQKNTLKYAKTFIDTGRTYPQDENRLPPLLRRLEVGSGKPPLKHGDDL
ncbi:MAG: hypothetical protein A2Y65_05660 [Deltaproteobacteria bacterium RBG_13_52_11]|nr:MAG: hypothetical protein A2Y65_05660 [Deltaproteobacteria bacterium RBG_13_52_11]